MWHSYPSFVFNSALFICLSVIHSDTIGVRTVADGVSSSSADVTSTLRRSLFAGLMPVSEFLLLCCCTVAAGAPQSRSEITLCHRYKNSVKFILE